MLASSYAQFRNKSAASEKTRLRPRSMIYSYAQTFLPFLEGFKLPGCILHKSDPALVILRCRRERVDFRV